MSRTLDILEAEVLKLPPEQRIRLLDRVVASLDTEAKRDEAWNRVAAEREASATEADWLDADQVLAELRAKHA